MLFGTALPVENMDCLLPCWQWKKAHLKWPAGPDYLPAQHLHTKISCFLLLSTCLGIFLCTDEMKQVLLRSAGSWLLLFPLPRACSMFITQLWWYPVVHCFTWITWGSSQSPERQQNSAQNEKLRNKGSYCALYQPVFTVDAIFTSASITSRI